jgi:hypothetical protein
MKPASDFYKSSSSKDGLAPSCKDCQNGRTPKVVPFGEQVTAIKTVIEKHGYTKKPKAPAPTQAPSARGLIPLEEPEEIEQQDDHLKARDWVWWKDPNRKKPLHPEEHWDAERAANIVSINHEKGTALVEYFPDHGGRTEAKALANITDLRRRIKYY